VVLGNQFHTIPATIEPSAVNAKQPGAGGENYGNIITTLTSGVAKIWMLGGSEPIFSMLIANQF
jgi:hypothetical protein